MIAAPDLYALNDNELADELRHIEPSHAVELQGPVTVTVGVRRCPLGGPDRPVIVATGNDGLHLLALPGDNGP